MFPQHILIISILTTLWTDPASLTAFDALALSLSVSPFLPLDRERIWVFSSFDLVFYLFLFDVSRLPGFV